MRYSKLLGGLLLSGSIIILSGCVSTNNDSDGSKKLTVGLVQKEIKSGVSSIKVLETLGSPNIVKNSPNTNGEVWIYDKISQTQNATTLGIAIGGGDSGVGGLLGANNQSSETSSRSLTVIIKFDKDDMVRDVSYFRSAF